MTSREKWLNIENMIRDYSGAQASMHDTTIKSEHGYLGCFPRTLDPGDTQSMFFKPSDVVPFLMIEKECNDRGMIEQLRVSS